MKRTKIGVYLPPEQVKLLRMASAVRNETRSEIVQRALGHYLRKIRIVEPPPKTTRP